MTITVQPARNEYTANAGQTIFNYTFKIFADTDLNVYITPAGEVADDDTQLTTAYTVTGIGDEDGGSITLMTGTNQDDLVTIVSNIPSSRTIDYQNNGDFRPVTVNSDFDRVVSIAKKIEETANRTLLLQQSQQDPKPLDLPLPLPGYILRWKADRTGMENVMPKDAGVDISAVTDLEAIARSLNVLDSQVIYASDNTTVLDDVLYIYDAGAQVIWSVPPSVGAGELIVSVASGQLETTGGTYTLTTINKSGIEFATIDDIDLGNSIGGKVSLLVGDSVAALDYAHGSNSGILFFKRVVFSGQIADGGKHIYLPISDIWLEQNIKAPHNVKAWGAVGNYDQDLETGADDTVAIANTLAYSDGSVYIPEGVYKSDPIIAPAYLKIYGDGPNDFFDAGEYGTTIAIMGVAGGDCLSFYNDGTRSHKAGSLADMTILNIADVNISSVLNTSGTATRSYSDVHIESKYSNDGAALRVVPFTLSGSSSGGHYTSYNGIISQGRTCKYALYLDTTTYGSNSVIFNGGRFASDFSCLESSANGTAIDAVTFVGTVFEIFYLTNPVKVFHSTTDTSITGFDGLEFYMCNLIDITASIDCTFMSCRFESYNIGTYDDGVNGEHLVYPTVACAGTTFVFNSKWANCFQLGGRGIPTTQGYLKFPVKTTHIEVNQGSGGVNTTKAGIEYVRFNNELWRSNIIRNDNDYLFTVTEAGLYQIQVILFLSNPTGSSASVRTQVKLSGRSLALLGVASTIQASESGQVQQSELLQLNEGENINIFVYSTVAGLTTSQTNTRLSITKVIG